MNFSFIFFLFGITACTAFEFRVYLGTIDNYVIIPYTNPVEILQHLNGNKRTLFYGHGLLGGPTVESVRTVVTKFLTQYKVVLLDWSKEAGNFLNIALVDYPLYNLPNAEFVGCEFGKALATLVNKGLDKGTFFTMGHSLGAQMLGASGRCAKLKGTTLPIIIALDRAGPGFGLGLPDLDSSCADLVMSIITDPDGLGKPTPAGHVSFFFNYNSTYTMQPGCTTKADLFHLNSKTTCSHDYSWRTICASVDNPEYFPAQSAANGDAWRAGEGNPNNIAYVRVDPTLGASGSYYLRASGVYPYSLGLAGTQP